MEAIAAYRGTIRINPEDADAHDSLGALLQTRGELEEAVAELRTAIRLKPELADAHYNLGTILKVKGKLPEAVEEFRNARDNAEPGSELAELIDRELVEADQ